MQGVSILRIRFRYHIVVEDYDLKNLNEVFYLDFVNVQEIGLIN